MGTRLRDDDSVEDVLHVNDHDHLLFFTTDGIVRSLRAHVVPYGSRTSAGTSISQARLPPVELQFITLKYKTCKQCKAASS